jgi:hypothetical protein
MVGMRHVSKWSRVQQAAAIIPIGLIGPALLSELFGWPALHEGARRFGTYAGMAFLFLIAVPIMLVDDKNADDR